MSRLATSQFSWPSLRAFSREAPMCDPTCGSNGPPRSRSNSYSPPRFSRPCDFEYPILESHPASSRVREILMSPPCVPPRWTTPIFSPLCYLVTLCLVTFNAKHLGVHPTKSRAHEISQSPTHFLLRWTAPVLSPLRALAPRDL
jgi:hypothetical protein